MRHNAILSAVLPKDFLPSVKYVIEKLRNTSCYVWSSMAEGWDRKNWPAAKETYLNHMDEEDNLYSLDELYSIITDNNFSERITGDKESIYFYIFNENIDINDRKEIPSIIQRMRALFVNANGVKKVDVSYGYKERSKEGYSTSRSNSLDSRFSEKVENNVKFYIFNDIKCACIRISGHEIKWDLFKRFLTTQTNRGTLNFFDPATKEEIDICIHLALKYVNAKLTGNFAKKDAKMEIKIYDYLLKASRYYLDSDYLNDIGIKTNEDGVFFDKKDFFKFRNNSEDYYNLLKFTIWNLKEKLALYNNSFIGDKERKEIQKLKEKLDPLEKIQQYIRKHIPAQLKALIYTNIEEARKRMDELFQDERFYSAINYYLGKRKNLKQIKRIMLNEKENGNVTDEEEDAIIEYFTLDSAYKDLKDLTTQECFKRIDAVYANIIRIHRELPLFDFFDSILK